MKECKLFAMGSHVALWDLNNRIIKSIKINSKMRDNVLRFIKSHNIEVVNKSNFNWL